MIAATNCTCKIQWCFHNRYGRLERAPGESKFRTIPHGSPRPPRSALQRVLPEAIPAELIRDAVGTGRVGRCRDCLTVHPMTEMVGGLCRGCFCDCGTLDTELRAIRREYRLFGAGDKSPDAGEVEFICPI
jgi:hypothetical protein